MTYQTTSNKTVRMIEFTKSSDQSVTSGDAITFDTKKTSGGDSVSVNSSTGAITLNSSKSYWITLNLHVERGSTTQSFSSAFYDSSGQITPENGGFNSDYSYGAFNSYSTKSPTFTAQFVIKYPTDTYYAKMISVGSSSSVSERTSLFILEVTE